MRLGSQGCPMVGRAASECRDSRAIGEWDLTSGIGG